MSTTTEMTWGGMNAVELGALIACLGVAVLLIITFVTVFYLWRSGSKGKEEKMRDDNEKMVSMQTSRIVGGKPMQQVIMKNQLNGNMDKHNSTSENLQTIDLETNTFRYDMASSSARTDPKPTGSEVEDDDKIVDLTHGSEDIDSGTGDSPGRTAVVVHSDGEDKDSQPSKRSSDSGANAKEGADNAAYSSEEEEIPFTVSVPIYPTPLPPPPPQSDPPPPTPGIPVTDLDDGETIIVPPPLPPPPEPDIYAEINKNRSDSSNENSIKRSYRDTAEIQIIEKEKF